MSVVNNDKLTSGQKRKFLDDALANDVISLQDYRNALSGSSNVNTNTNNDVDGLNKKVKITPNPN